MALTTLILAIINELLSIIQTLIELLKNKPKGKPQL